TPNGTMAHTRSSQIWLKKIKVVHTLLNMNSPKYKLSTPNSFVAIGCFRREGVSILKTLFEQRFVKSHFQIAITRKVFKLAPSNFLGLEYDTITYGLPRVWLGYIIVFGVLEFARTFYSTLCGSIFEGRIFVESLMLKLET